jgi:hypothetical protein
MRVLRSRRIYATEKSPGRQFTVLSRKASAFLGRGYKALFLLFLRVYPELAGPQKRPMGGQPKASSLSSAEVRRWWEEPSEETAPKPGSVAILAL